MARASLTPQTLKGPYPGAVSADDLDITWAALDAGDGNDFTFTGEEILLFRNDNAGAQTVTLTSVADRFGRKGDITTYSIGAGEYAAFAATAIDGWQQSDGKFYIDTSSADVKCAVLRLS